MVASSPSSTTTNSTGRLYYVYDTVMHGFAAELTDEQARLLANTTGVSGVYKSRVLPLHTTRSPGFLGLDTDFGVWPDTEFGDGVVIGFVDSGIWPESASFDDTGLGPVRSSWKGRCVDGQRFNSSTMCNNKLVGARNFVVTGTGTPLVGHGTHVSSTAAGSAVPNAGLFGFANGTARGVAPRARVAMYKACDKDGCSEAAIVAGIDAAVKDGVDVLSLSLGTRRGDGSDLSENSMAIALFGAVRAGVFVACSAGNSGPTEATLSNVAPWIATVAAATLDRVFPVFVTLGDGQVLVGQSLYTQKANKTEPLGLVLSEYCDEDDLVPDRIMGKVVVCSGVDEVVTGMAVQQAGGSGLLVLDTSALESDGLDALPFTLPSAILGVTEATKLLSYLHSSPHPVASFRIAGATVTGETRAPAAASFSSRGPSRVSRELLKPDFVAPGVNVLAAWPDESTLTGGAKDDPRRSPFNFLSGTSMACPHVAGVAALIRKKYPTWTPAMVRSAIATTATARDSEGRAIADGGLGGRATPMAVGAGLVQPRLALDPGLVYDAGEQDYVDFLCTLNYTAAQVRLFVPGFRGCTRTLPGGVAGLNYPSFVVAFSGNGTDAAVRVLERTVTKVSEGAETYTVRVEAPKHLVAVNVTPATLVFGEQKNEKKSYKVAFRSRGMPKGSRGKTVMRFGNIVWENDAHKVTSPVVFIWG
ncbi:hypothetical protein PR202_gb21404 [Eleusine coracana subsp. coracana]|uniref:Subtilisin-like protease SBT1.7 n=1 Tax=Eleusine coracana subsp. coracana TaxID=191504 RepID=A0AAV5FF47_ELECO|nr:hypothetical protein PR202_gb21404 [Eleusine coracana subsp. coracana]